MDRFLMSTVAVAAAMHDLAECAPCRFCKHDEHPAECEHRADPDRSRCFEWRGPTPEFVRAFFDAVVEMEAEKA